MKLKTINSKISFIPFVNLNINFKLSLFFEKTYSVRFFITLKS